MENLHKITIELVTDLVKVCDFKVDSIEIDEEYARYELTKEVYVEVFESNVKTYEILSVDKHGIIYEGNYITIELLKAIFDFKYRVYGGKCSKEFEKNHINIDEEAEQELLEMFEQDFKYGTQAFHL